MKKISSIKRKRKVKDPLKYSIDFGLLVKSMILNDQLLWYLLNRPWDKVAIHDLKTIQKNLTARKRFVNKVWRLTDPYL